MIKVVYNACFGGFSLSRKAAERLAELGYEEAATAIEEQSKQKSFFGEQYSFYDLPRHDSRLVQVVEELGEAASGNFAELKVAKIKGLRYRIDEYDGNESVQTPNDIEWIIVK